MNEPTGHLPRLYADLAWLWPMWGDPAAEYADYDARVAALIERYARRPVETLLDIACGGGKNLFNLKRRYRVAGLDLSPAMLALARRLNPDVELIEGDMRSFSLDRTFDAVLMDDGVSCLTSRADLAAAFQAAFRHLNPGGIMIVTPDTTKENFQQNRTVATPAAERFKPANMDVVFVENVYDPDPSDDHYEGLFVYLIRENGALRVETDRCTLGLFSMETWRDALSEAGFSMYENMYTLGGDTYTVLACVKPL